jgi:hypothetical protein
VCPISRLSATTELYEKVNVRIVQRHTEGSYGINAAQIGFHSRQSMTICCLSRTDHVNLNFNNMSTAAMLMFIEKVFDTVWHPGVLY